MKKTILLFSGFLGTGILAHSQMVGADAYMHGNYVEIGINGTGGFEGVDTTASMVPAGYHYRSNTNNFGFVSNPQMDGWINFDGDFYSPGSPENGWGIEIFDTTSTDTINIVLNNNMATGSNIVGSISSYNYSSGVTTVVWDGNYVSSGYDISISIKYELGDNDLFYNTTVTMVNNGPQNIEELYFYRNIDPDNNVTLTSDYTTSNTIVSQIPCCTYACVTATQASPWSSLFSFYSADTGAVVGYGGFTNRDASNIYNGIGFVQTVGSVNFADEAVHISFKGENFMSLTRASGSPVLQFKFQTVLGQDALTELQNSTAVNELNEGITAFYPNPTSDVLNIESESLIQSITIRDISGKMVSMQTLNSTRTALDVKNLKSGIYFVTITSNEAVVTKRFVKN